jgi:hypothetical protein
MAARPDEFAVVLVTMRGQEIVKRGVRRDDFRHDSVYRATILRSLIKQANALSRPGARHREQRTQPRGRRTRSSTGSRDPPEPDLPRPSEPGDAGLVVVPAEAAL